MTRVFSEEEFNDIAEIKLFISSTSQLCKDVVDVVHKRDPYFSQNFPIQIIRLDTPAIRKAACTHRTHPIKEVPAIGVIKHDDTIDLFVTKPRVINFIKKYDTSALKYASQPEEMIIEDPPPPPPPQPPSSKQKKTTSKKEEPPKLLQSEVKDIYHSEPSSDVVIEDEQEQEGAVILDDDDVTEPGETKEDVTRKLRGLMIDNSSKKQSSMISIAEQARQLEAEARKHPGLNDKRKPNY